MTLSTTDIDYLNQTKLPWGACYTFNDIGNVNCNHYIADVCYNGFFLKGETCDVSKFPSIKEYGTNFWISDGISTSDISGSIVGSPFRGGLYCGKFKPSDHSLTDNVNHIKSNDTKSYALILYDFLFSEKYLTTNVSINKNTSNYSGGYNSAFANHIIPSINKENPFRDWYFSSIVELSFLQKQYTMNAFLRSKINNLLENFRNPDKFVITSSSIFSVPENSVFLSNKIDGKYLYGLDFRTNKIILTNPHNISNFFCLRSIEIIP